MSLPELNAQQVIDQIESGKSYSEVLAPIVAQLGGNASIMIDSGWSAPTRALYLVALLMRAEGK